MTEQLVDVRRRAIRRSRYGMNTLALFERMVPPEGPFDAALTNGLLLIAAHEMPGSDFKQGGRAKAASELLKLLGANPVAEVDVDRLQEGLDLTQPFRHGRADEEWVTMDGRHVQALMNLDEHPAARVLDTARAARDVDECLWRTFIDEAEGTLPSRPKDRLGVPDPEICDDCGRPTLLVQGWDDFGGTDSPGYCVACGFERSAEAADERALDSAYRAARENPRW